MKKAISLLLILTLLLSGCVAQSQPLSADSFLYYYPAKAISYENDGALITSPAASELEGQALDSIVRSYLDAPIPEGAQRVLPLDWHLSSVEQDNATASLIFEGFPTNSLLQSLAFACLSKTLLQLPDIQRLSISYPGTTEPMVLTENDIFLTDTGMLPQEAMLTLYFPDAARRYLVRETVAVDAAHATDSAKCIVEQLLSAQENGHSTSCIPEGTELLSVDVENGICTVNFSSQFLQGFERSFAAERMAVYCIVNSLTELPEITSVDFLIAGAPVETLCRMELSSGVVRDESILATTSKKGVSDVTLYPLSDQGGLLVPIPVTLEIADQKDITATVINALIDYEEQYGMHRCIPAGTKLLSARMENTTCVLDLTAEFLAGCSTEAEEQLAVRSVVATMCTLPYVQSVDILVEGLEPVYRSRALSTVQKSAQGWLTE